jgi:glycosyltransferase involved in cell wall biosynthesis
MQKKITIFIPTYNRPNRLARFFSYINLCLISNKIPLKLISILIVDGSEFESIEIKDSIVKLFGKGLNIELIRMPGRSLTERYLIGAKIIETEYVLTCGDDDLPDFIGINQWLQLEDNADKKMIFAGRYTNVYGLSLLNLITKNAERPYAGFKIENSSPLLRVSQYALANAFGVTSLAYSIQPIEIFINFWKDVNHEKLNFYYGGIELMHQTYLTAQLSINLADVNLIYRDFSYIGYTKVNQREAPTDDIYPYYGSAAVEKCVEYINFYCKTTPEDSAEIVKDILCMNKQIEKSKTLVQSNLENIISNKINCGLGYPQKEIEAAWRSTYFSCYPKIDALKKILILSIPSNMIIPLKTLKNSFTKI